MMWSLSTSGSGRGNGWATLALLFSFAGLAVQQKDPINDFCRRWGHQSAVVDDKLYIDGGVNIFKGDTKHENYTNTYLIYHDLSSTDSSGMPTPYANLSKNSTIPSVNGGILWPDTVNKRFYLYGGEYLDQDPVDFSLYAYDILNNVWDNYGAGDDIVALSYGAGVSLSDRGQGYYYGGWMSNSSVPDWDGDSIPTSYLLVYDMDSNKWTNSSGPDDIGRAEGIMVYLPAGDGGMLIYFGGVRQEDGKQVGQPLDEIIIFDVLSGKTYTQNATGDVPDNRRRFCAGASWADDRSSYNIYIYGGASIGKGDGYDDVYVLSIPTFTWVKMYPDTDGTGDYPHHSLTCNIVNEARMIVHGGFFPKDDSCDSVDQYGLHGMDLGRKNDDKALWQVWQPNKTDYVVPADIISVIGGKSTGGATKTAPSKGWGNNDLEALMTRTASVGSRTATRDVGDSTSTSSSDSGSDSGDSSSSLSGGAIAGIAVGSAAGVALIMSAAWFLFRRRRAKHQPVSKNPPMTQTGSEPSRGDAVSHGPRSPGSNYASMSPPPFQLSPSPGHRDAYKAPAELGNEGVTNAGHMVPYAEMESNPVQQGQWAQQSPAVHAQTPVGVGPQVAQAAGSQNQHMQFVQELPAEPVRNN